MKNKLVTFFVAFSLLMLCIFGSLVYIKELAVSDRASDQDVYGDESLSQSMQPEVSQGQNNSQEKNQSGNIDSAREALIEYFDLLNKKQYAEAAKYHGASYEILCHWNPGVDENDYPGLLKRGCEENGWQCLKIKNIMDQEQVSSVDFKFNVQFANDDNSLFKAGPCCGATEEQMPAKTDFEFFTKFINDNYIVTPSPIYLP